MICVAENEVISFDLREVNINRISTAQCDDRIAGYNIGDYHVCFLNEGTADGICNVSTKIIKHNKSNNHMLSWQGDAVRNPVLSQSDVQDNDIK
jgi:hypothetical protein